MCISADLSKYYKSYYIQKDIIILLIRVMTSTKENQNLVFNTFEDFYPFYLSQHSNQINRRLHVIGTILSIIQLIRIILISASWFSYLMLPVTAYGLAWIGHFCFEKNKPATFKWPVYSFFGDLRMVS